MKLTLESIRDAFRSYYDRVIAFLAILALLGSLVVLVMRIGNIKADEQKFQGWKQGLAPAFEHATNVTLDLFDQGHNSLTNPFQIGEWKRNLSVPELRVACQACNRPIPYEASVCPLCGFKPGDLKENTDKDGDGMLDEWESANALNPLDTDDAKGDPDKDGFSNLEEFLFKTNPGSAANHPPLIAKLHVTSIKAMPFDLKFMAVNTFTSGDKFQINSTLSKQSKWFKMGDAVEGYIVTNYTRKIVKVPKFGAEVEVDESTLTLQHKATGRMIVLRKGVEVPINEYEVKMVLDIDASTYEAKQAGDFTLKGTVYTVKEIDSKNGKVLISEKDSGKDTWIGRQAETGAPPQ